MKKTGPVTKRVATQHAKFCVQEVMKEVLSESEEVHSCGDSDDEVPPLREDIVAFSTFKQQLLHDCSTTDADLDLSGGNSLSNWWSDSDDEDKPQAGLNSTLSTTASTALHGLSSSWGSSSGSAPASSGGSAPVSFSVSAPVSSVPSASDDEHRQRFYQALRKPDTRALSQLQASLPRTMDFQVLHAQVELALDVLRDAECTRGQLWASFCRSPGRGAGYCDETPAGAAVQTQRLVRQARHLLASLPASLAAQWDPRTSADVLGRLAFAPPVRLLSSLCDTVEGTPMLRGPTPCMREALLLPPAAPAVA